MARSKIWRMSPSEELVLSVDLSADLEDDATLTGTPSVSVWTKSSGTYTNATTDFDIEATQVNTTAIEREDGGTTAIGKGVVFRLTASSTQGTYYVRVGCAASDATEPVTERTLIVSGAGEPA